MAKVTDYRAAREALPEGTHLVRDEFEPGMVADKPFDLRWKATQLAKRLEVLGYEASVATIDNALGKQESWLYIRIPQ